ncbi:MAG: amidase [Alphaproteobacteria bacterium]
MIQLPLSIASEAIRTRQISPVELTRASLERASALNPRLNCLLTIAEQEALRSAELAEREICAGRYRGPLHGIPYTVKDIFETEGILTTAGSAILANWVPKSNAAVVERLEHAGAILIGKAHLSEFAAGPTNGNDHYGPARNPWNLACVTGGSSGGSAAAVAAGIGAFSIGTDTGGSIRMPGALCGTFAHKPSFGLVSRAGCLPLSWSLDTVGILSKNARDGALVLNAMVGRDSRDPGSTVAPSESHAGNSQVSMEGLRVGIPRELMEEPCDESVRSAVAAAIETLARLGADIREIGVPWVLRALPVSNLITAAEARAAHAPWYPNESRRYGKHMQELLLMGSAIGAADYIAALRVRRAIVQRTQALFETIDLVALPTVSVPAPDIGQDQVTLSGTAMPTFTALRRYMRWASLTGQPAASVPCGRSPDGRPIGLQLIGRMYEDATVLSVAHQYEATRAWPLPLAEI